MEVELLEVKGEGEQRTCESMESSCFTKEKRARGDKDIKLICLGVEVQNGTV